MVELFVMEVRRRLWFKYRAIVISNLQKALPACARPFEVHYIEFFLLKFVFRKFDAGFPEGRSWDEFEEWLEQLVKEVVAEEIPKLINDKGELIDEELVQLATSGHEAARVQLMEHYSPKIKNLVAGIVYKHGLCPPSQDVPTYIEDTAQNVCLKIMAKLESYRFEQPFEHWVAAICTNEVLLGERDTVGRAELPRVFVSWEDFLQQAPSPVIRVTEHREILKKAIDKYIEQGGERKRVGTQFV
jgi:DNA-directed RNA polymerase specialized sigma24 family protein